MQKRFEAEIIEIKDYFFKGKLHARYFKLKALEDFSFNAGQFVMLASPNFKLWSNPKELKWGAFSIASSPFDLPFLEFIVRIKETNGLTNHLGFNVSKGMHLMLEGPYGEFNLKPEDKQRIFIAAGTGIAPFISFLRSMKKNNFIPTTLFYGSFNESTAFFLEELKQLSNSFNLKLNLIFSEPEKGTKGFVQDLIKNYGFPEKKNDIGCYVCGNPLMVEQTIALLKQLGFKRIYSEGY